MTLEQEADRVASSRVEADRTIFYCTVAITKQALHSAFSPEQIIDLHLAKVKAELLALLKK